MHSITCKNCDIWYCHILNISAHGYHIHFKTEYDVGNNDKFPALLIHILMIKPLMYLHVSLYLSHANIHISDTVLMHILTLSIDIIRLLNHFMINIYGRTCYSYQKTAKANEVSNLRDFSYGFFLHYLHIVVQNPSKAMSHLAYCNQTATYRLDKERFC